MRYIIVAKHKTKTVAIPSERRVLIARIMPLELHIPVRDRATREQLELEVAAMNRKTHRDFNYSVGIIASTREEKRV
jgi:hypothetical protein